LFFCLVALAAYLGLSLVAPLAEAQISPIGFDATNLREPADLGTVWLVHGGDDEAFARPISTTRNGRISIRIRTSRAFSRSTVLRWSGTGYA
jgi:hypothetical protein